MYTLFKSVRSTFNQFGGGGKGGSGDMFGMGKANAKIFGIENKVKIRFKDVAVEVNHLN